MYSKVYRLSFFLQLCPLSKITTMDSKMRPRMMDKILTWNCTGVTSSSQNIDVPFNVSKIQCVRVSYSLDDSEDGYSGLQCPALFGNEIIATFSDSKSAADSGYELVIQAPRVITGSYAFTWPSTPARAGIIFVHLRFSE